MKLTLTKSEREAFDWVGNRYATGYQVAREIMRGIPEGKEWDDDGDITFDIPEPAAWNIAHFADEEENLWPCFAPKLTAKMVHFCAELI